MFASASKFLNFATGRVHSKLTRTVTSRVGDGDRPPSLHDAVAHSVKNRLGHILSGAQKHVDETGERFGALVESAVTQTQFISPKAARKAYSLHDWKTLETLADVTIRRSAIAFDTAKEYPPEIRSFFYNNARRVNVRTFIDRGFFGRLSRGQDPIAAYIGCVDSRFDIHRMLGTAEGEMLIDRNVANVVDPSEASMEAFLTVAIETCHVPHMIVCGHVGCGGIKLAMQGTRGQWFERIRNVYQAYREELAGISDQDELYNVVAALNVREQVLALAASTKVQAAWARGDELNLYGWVYGINTGYINDLGVWLKSAGDFEAMRASEAKFRTQLQEKFGNQK